MTSRPATSPPARAERAGVPAIVDTPHPCPICGEKRSARHRPFCSPRCREIDLGRWFTGAYAVPAVEPPDDFDPDGSDP